MKTLLSWSEPPSELKLAQSVVVTCVLQRSQKRSWDISPAQHGPRGTLHHSVIVSVLQLHYELGNVPEVVK